MRKNVTRSSSGVDWSLPTSVSAWSLAPGDYQLSYFTATTAIGENISLIADTYASQDVIQFRGNSSNTGDSVAIVCSYDIDEGAIVNAPSRSYSLTGHVDLEPSPTSPDWDAEQWTVQLIGFAEDGQTGAQTTLIDFDYAKTVDNSTDTNDDFDQSFTMPTGIKSFRVNWVILSDLNNSNNARFHWRDFLLALD